MIAIIYYIAVLCSKTFESCLTVRNKYGKRYVSPPRLVRGVLKNLLHSSNFIKFGTQDEHKCMLPKFCFIFKQVPAEDVLWLWARSNFNTFFPYWFTVWRNSIRNFCTYCGSLEHGRLS